MSFTEGKVRHMKALSDKNGVIAAAAMDQRGSLQKTIASAKGVPQDQVTNEMMSEFKVAVSRILTPHASAILLDPEYGIPAANARSKNAGLLLAYEESGYDNTKPGRLPDLLPHVSAKRILDWGGDAVKILLYYNAFDDPKVNDIKHAFIERIGAECEANDVPFFLEFVSYDPKGGDEKGLEFAKQKPKLVKGAMVEFSKPQYGVDVLKVEVPVQMEFVAGTRSFKGEQAYTRKEALEHFRLAASSTHKPFIYLSAGVSNPVFIETLELANESGASYNGVLCGRATWKDGIAIYAKQGAKAFEAWLSTTGVENIENVNKALRAAHSWHDKVNIPALV